MEVAHRRRGAIHLCRKWPATCVLRTPPPTRETTERFQTRAKVADPAASPKGCFCHGHFMRHERLTLPCTRLWGAGVTAACPRRVLGSSANLQRCPPRVRVMPFLLVGGYREMVLSAPISPTGSIRLCQRVTEPADLTLMPLRVDTLGDRLIGDIAPRGPA